jgi:hypothetical protein
MWYNKHKQGGLYFLGSGYRDSEALLHAISASSGANRHLVILERGSLTSEFDECRGYLPWRGGEHFYAYVFLI